uniref:C2H2-type domain-containing protein n=1 Tax=Esox lucius TaxID=8010 RepID=A0A3P8Z528_ESOLU
MTKLQLLNSLLIKQLEVTVQEVMRMVNDTVAEYIEETARAKCENARLRKKLREITLVAAPEATSNPFSIYDVEDEQGESFQSLVQNRVVDGDAQPKESQEQNPEPGLDIEVLLAGMDVECSFPAVEVEMGIGDTQINTQIARGGKHGRVSCRGKQSAHSFAAQAQKGIHCSRNRTYLCGWCGKAFYNRQDLERHERVHTGAKPFQCSFCEKSFSLFCNMKRHERLHTGERPFCCPECEKTFADQSSLRNHMSSHVRYRELTS